MEWTNTHRLLILVLRKGREEELRKRLVSVSIALYFYIKTILSGIISVVFIFIYFFINLRN